VEENLRHATMTADPAINAKWFTVPALFIQPVEQILRNIKYSEKASMNGGNFFFNGGMDDDDGGYSEDDAEQENVEY